MANFDFDYTLANLLSKLKVGDVVYNLKDTDARAAIEFEINRLGAAAYRGASDTVVEDGNELVSGKAVAAYLEGTLADVTKALIFQGVSSTDPASGTVTIDGQVWTGSKGDVVLFGSKEFVFDGSAWIELGDEGIYLTKAEAVTTYVAKTLTIAGIALDANISVEQLQSALGLKALAYKASASGTIEGLVTGISDIEYTPTGSVGVEVQTTSTTMASSGTFTPAGNVSGNVTAAGNVAIARDDANGVAVSGTVSAPTITVTPATAQVQHIDSVGTLPTYTAAQYTAPSVSEAKSSFASEGIVAAIDGTDTEMLVFSNAGKAEALTATGFNAGSYTAAEFNAGALPTLGAAQTVVTGITSATASAPTFTGDKFGATFTGSEVAITASFAGTEGNVNVSGNYDKATGATGSFTGTGATLKHEITTGSKTVTVQ